MSNDLISEFLDEKTVAALPDFLSKDTGFEDAANLIAQAFGASSGFSSMNDDNQKKLLQSFKRNLKLLIEKTWVEDQDIAIKEKVLYQLERLCTKDECNWTAEYPLFLEIIGAAVSLMFGAQTTTEDFAEYSLRIDPEFGIFWWYISSLPAQIQWNNDKCRVAIEIGMYFLANY